MSSIKKRLIRDIRTANLGCGCGKKPKPSDIYQPKPKAKSTVDLKPTSHSQSSISSLERRVGDEEEDHTSTAFSLNISTSIFPHCSEHENDPPCSKMLSPCPKISNSMALVKDSEDPYHDFRNSMLQMILEKDIYSKDDLQELLNCFLQLNSPNHHDIIVQAFTEIRNEVISGRRN